MKYKNSRFNIHPTSCRKTAQGFTIVELLIVIVVIGILATLIIVAYTGLQQRARNTQTLTAAAAWVKIIRAYNADIGSWPGGTTCLGENYPKGFSGSESSGTECAQATGYNVQASIVNQLKPYMGDGAMPNPDFQVVGDAEGNWTRGIRYTNSVGGGGYWVGFTLVGTTECPDIGGTTRHSSVVYTGGVLCRANLAAS